MDQAFLSTSWSEHFQSGCYGAEETQPLQMALDLVEQSASLKIRTNVAPSQYQNGAPDVGFGRFPSFIESCQLCLAWALYGSKRDSRFSEAASKLAGWILPQIRLKFFSLGSLDRVFCEKQTRLYAGAFLLACGLEKEAEEFYSQDLPKSQFLSRVMNEPFRINAGPEIESEPALGYQLLKSDRVGLALSLCGYKTGMGSFRIGQLYVPSFGPQTTPVTDRSLFGLHSPLSEGGWFRGAALPETWFQLDATVRPDEIHFKWNQLGTDRARLSALSFYLTADSCRIQSVIYKPKALQKFLGETDCIEIFTGSQCVRMRFECKQKIELIPLAGGDSFWGASFLLLWWLPSFDGISICELLNSH